MTVLKNNREIFATEMERCSQMQSEIAQKTRGSMNEDRDNTDLTTNTRNELHTRSMGRLGLVDLNKQFNTVCKGIAQATVVLVRIDNEDGTTKAAFPDDFAEKGNETNIVIDVSA